MNTSVDHHVDVKGVTPSVLIINWGDYITVRISIGTLRTTSYIYPLAGESTKDFIERVVAELGSPVLDVPYDERQPAKN